MYGKFLPLTDGGGDCQCAMGESGRRSARDEARRLHPPQGVGSAAEIGIKHEGRSKRTDEFQGVDFDLVVTVCDSAAEECPVWLGKGKSVHHSFFDPAQTDDMEDFRRVRDEIAQVIPQILETA
jgi:arsenate reductase (thioredoxin)